MSYNNKHSLLKKIFYQIKNSQFGGTLIAIYYDLKSLYFNIKSLTIHVINYYSIKLKTPKNKKLHLGCGFDYKKGFINIDMKRNADYYFDARNKLPFIDGTIEYIYSSHFVEHLKNDELMEHFKECYRILKVGGIYRICVPDFERLIKAYVNKDFKFFEKAKYDNPTGYSYIPIDYQCNADIMDRGFHEYGEHKIFLDKEKITNMLLFSGFQNEKIIFVLFDPSIDREERKDYSFYIEAQK